MLKVPFCPIPVSVVCACRDSGHGRPGCRFTHPRANLRPSAPPLAPRATVRDKKTEMGGLVSAHISDLLPISKMAAFCKINIIFRPHGPHPGGWKHLDCKQHLMENTAFGLKAVRTHGLASGPPGNQRFGPTIRKLLRKRGAQCNSNRSSAWRSTPS